MTFFVHPAGVAAVAAAALRLAVGFAALSQNPLLADAQLDSKYYLDWAREIAAGDLASAHGIVQGPFVLNPLYAYVLAPIARTFADPTIPVVVLQALLAAATAALAALAARRFFGRSAAWTAGLVVAFSTALVQLDLHVAVSGLAALLVAGAVFASAPPREGSSGRGHGPVAAGIWLGLGALARPITPLALPFFAWKEFTAAAPGRIRRAALVLVTFAACVLPSLVRNWAVGGEPIVFTAASGLNLHLGNNPESRRYRGMATSCFQFSPIDMHEDARRYVKSQRGGEPTPSEVSSYFTRMTIEECIHEPLASAAFYAQKARWFFAPAEVPSTASLANDLRFTPLLHAAFVPTWLVAAAGLVGLVLHRRRREVLLGPGALVFAHVVVLTLVFPISHYRSPAIPALAVLAGGAVEWAVAAWRREARGRVVAAGASVLGIAGLAAIPPQPDPMRHADAMLLAYHYRDVKRYDEAERFVRESLDEAHAMGLSDEEAAPTFFMLGELAQLEGRLELAIERLDGALRLQQGNLPGRLRRSRVHQDLGNWREAETDARRVAEEFPLIPEGHARLGAILWRLGKKKEAAPHLQYAHDQGMYIDPGVLRECQELLRSK